MASEADIIATLYFDSMDIYRKEKVKNPNETGTAYISAAYKLFCRPTVDIQVGDKLVITYNGITGEFEAGEPYPYKSHIETPLTKKERV
ncbi:MAG: hypothetical protein KHZ96_13615 [Coprobacillus sp.]|nr:hypothetical protein [Coprobacillus sp.]